MWSYWKHTMLPKANELRPFSDQLQISISNRFRGESISIFTSMHHVKSNDFCILRLKHVYIFIFHQPINLYTYYNLFLSSFFTKLHSCLLKPLAGIHGNIHNKPFAGNLYQSVLLWTSNLPITMCSGTLFNKVPSKLNFHTITAFKSKTDKIIPDIRYYKL